MTVKTFKEKIVELGGTIVSDEPYNSNNSWGFGGMIGRLVTATLGDLRLSFKYGKAIYRHMDPDNVDVVRVNGHLKPFDTDYFFRLYATGARTLEQLIETHERNT